MAGIFAGHVKTWFYSANTPDKDSNSTTEPADGTVTTLVKDLFWCSHSRLHSVPTALDAYMY